MLLSVDGLDYELIRDMGISSFKYNKKMKIPIECFVMSAEGMTPHTTRVWATIFTGTKIDYGSIRRTGLRSWIHDLLVASKITWTRGKKDYSVNPYNMKLDLIFDYYHSFNWNCPTISPEWIATFPDYRSFEEYSKKELLMWFMMSEGATEQLFDLCSFYTRFIDYVGHNKPDELEIHYHSIFNHVNLLVNCYNMDVVLLSDHGTLEGIHTDYAYIGSNYPIVANSLEELRGDFERILLLQGVDKIKQVEIEKDLTDEEEKAITRRLKGLGYLD